MDVAYLRIVCIGWGGCCISLDAVKKLGCP